MDGLERPSLSSTNLTLIKVGSNLNPRSVDLSHLLPVFSRARSFNRWITKKDDLFNVWTTLCLLHVTIDFSALDREGLNKDGVPVAIKAHRVARHQVERPSGTIRSGNQASEYFIPWYCPPGFNHRSLVLPVS